MAKNGTRKHRTQTPREHRTQTPRGAASPTSARRLEAHNKQRQALALRMAGASFDEIAESLGYADRGGAFKAVMTALNSTLLEPAAEVRELELKRLDRLWLAVWDLATKGDLQAVDACLRIMKRRADFEGLDAPRDMRHSGNVQLNLTDEQRAERITALLERARARAQIVEGDAGGEKSSPSDVPQPAPGLANGSAPTHSPTPPPPPPLFGT